MKSNDALVSVVMPLFNTSAYLKKSIESVLSQSYHLWELLIIDDGSTDNSWSIMQDFSTKDNRIKIFHQENSGVSAARNVGLKNMTGDFLCFLDSDDWLPPNSLELRLKKFNESNEIYFVDGYVDIFSEDSNQLQRIWRPSFTGKPLQKLLRLSDQCFFGPTWMIRVSDIKPLFDEGLKHGEDLLYYIELAHLGTYAFVRNTTYCYRNRTASAMKNIEGLGEGYRKLKRKLSVLNKFEFWDKTIFTFKTKKIMFLSFLNAGKVNRALLALVE